MICSRCGVTFTGRADARFCSAKCRVAASREKTDESSVAPVFSEQEKGLLASKVQRGTANLKTKVPDSVDIDEPRHTSSLPSLPRNRSAPPLEEYVEQMVREARFFQLQRKWADPGDKDGWVGEAVASAERYARWRWQGFRAGEVVSL